MSITSMLSNDGQELLIQINGRFDFSTLQMFRNAYEGTQGEPLTYKVDLKGSDYIDSSALGMLLALRDHAGGDDARIKIVNCSNDIKKIMFVTKLNELFDIE